jgi:hypothetical protein
VHPSRPERPAPGTKSFGTRSFGTGRPYAWRKMAGKACGKGQVRAGRTKGAQKRPAPVAIRLNGHRLRRWIWRRAVGHQVLVHGRCAPAGARPGEKSTCLRPRRTALALPMFRTVWFDLSQACQGRTSGRGGADPPPIGVLPLRQTGPGVTHPPDQAMAHRRPVRPFASTGHTQDEAY